MSERPDGDLEELFAEAIKRKPEERGNFLDEVCVGDTNLRNELDELLSLRTRADGFFEDLAGDIVESASLELETAARPKIRIGSYQVEEAVGRGGMGVVYRASRVDGAFDHQVALKLLHLDMQVPQLRSRFLTERQLLAKFDHPNIARLLDGGVTDEGRPYFVMELIDGQPITTYCQENRLTLEQSLRLFLTLVDAVSYLHRNLVVHRDLKPSNVFVRRDRVVKLLDFGVAKLLEEDAGEAFRTLTGEQLLTPQYAAPEQLRNEKVTTATDVYGLGAVLYELLSGQRAHDRASRDIPSLEHETTTSPSEALSRARRERTDEPGRQWRQLPRDLDNICLMALRPEPERRYDSAEQLGQDIERHLDGLPVRASADTLAYRVAKFLKRNRNGVLAGSFVLALLAFGFARERGLRDRAQQAALKAEAVSGFLGNLFSSADPANTQGSEVTVGEVLEQAEAVLAADNALKGQPGVESEVRVILGQTYEALGKTEAAQVQLEKALELAGGLESKNLAAMTAAEGLARNRSLSWERREPLFRRVIEVRKEELGPEHPDTLSAMGGLVRVLRAPGRYPEAETLARETLDKRAAVLGTDHPDTLRAMNSLAAVMYETARYQEASTLYEDALAISRAHLGPSHPDTLRLVSNLGSSYTALGRYGDAEPLQRKVVRERLRVLGEGHHQTGMSMHNLGTLLLQLGQYPEAETWFRRAVTARAEMGSAGYLFSKSFLADTLRELERLEEAEELYVETLDEYKEKLPGHADEPRVIAALAELRYKQGRIAAAEELASQALEKHLSAEGEKQLDASDTLHLLARIRIDRTQFDEATDLADRALAIREKILGPSHPTVLESRIERTRILLAAGRPTPACEALQVHYDELAASPNLDLPKIQEPLVFVIDGCESAGKLLNPDRYRSLLN